MYLSQSIADLQGQVWQMVGVLPTATQMSDRLTLGYRRATAQQDSPLLTRGTTVWGHEFHRSRLQVLPQSPLYQIQGYNSDTVQPEGWKTHQVHASYVHLHWGACPELPLRFLQHCDRRTIAF